MKIYTKTGDTGKTSLIGGKRVFKHHIRIEAYGTVDELIAHLALLRDYQSSEFYNEQILKIQSALMTCGAILAADCDDCKENIPKLSNNSIVDLENLIDQMENELPELKTFILPGGDKASSVCHIARTVCRRAERLTISLTEQTKVPDNVIKYLNRLSDFLFVLSRKILFDKKISEVPWNPEL